MQDYKDRKLRHEVKELIHEHLTPAKESISETFKRTGRIPDKAELSALRKSSDAISIKKNCELSLVLEDKDVDALIGAMTIRMIPSVNEGIFNTAQILFFMLYLQTAKATIVSPLAEMFLLYIFFLIRAKKLCFWISEIACQV